ncbi:MAG: hypothetical protein ACI4IX_09610 [Acutalibacteraceae bacterium]
MKISKKLYYLIPALFMLLSILPVTVLAVDYDAEYNLNAGFVTIDAEGTYRIYQSDIKESSTIVEESSSVVWETTMEAPLPDEEPYFIPDSPYYSASGSVTSNTITVNCNCTIYLDGVNILVPSPSNTGDYSKPNPFNINGPYKVTVYLVDGSVNTLASAEGYYDSDTFENDTRLRCGSGRAAIGVPAGAELIINGSDGILNAYGANGHNISAANAWAGGGAGIGGDGAWANGSSSNAEASGKVTVNGGVINAVGGDNKGYWGGGGAGIGGGGGKYNKVPGGSSDSIIINGGTVNATGGCDINGSNKRNGNALGSGATGVGSGDPDYAATAPIEINGGTVTINRFQKNNANETITVGEDGTLIISSDTDNKIIGEVINYGRILCYSHSIKAVEAKEPTCTEDGNIAHYQCNVCKKLFADEEGETELTAEDVVIPASHSLEYVERKEATCTEDGNIAHWKCSVCDKLFADEEATTELTLEDVVISTSHSLEKVERNEPTCTEDGNIAHWKCSVCDKLFADEEGTTELTAEDVVITANGHSLDKTDRKEATCTEDGNIEYYTCAVCNRIFEDEKATTEITLEDTVITASGHDYDSVVTPPTCTESGYTTHTCANCGDSYVDSEVPATGHSYKDGRCVNCGSDDPATIGGPEETECTCIFCSIGRWLKAFVNSCKIWLTEAPVSIGKWFVGVFNSIASAIK